MVGKYLLRSSPLVPSWNLTTWEAEAEGFWMLQSQPALQLHRDLVSNNRTKQQQKVPREFLSQKWGLCPVSCGNRPQSQSKGQGFQGVAASVRCIRWLRGPPAASGSQCLKKGRQKGRDRDQTRQEPGLQKSQRQHLHHVQEIRADQAR